MQEGNTVTVNTNLTITDKRGGNFRTTGDTIQEFPLAILDEDVFCIADTVPCGSGNAGANAVATGDIVSLRNTGDKKLDPIPSFSLGAFNTFEGTNALPGATRLQIDFTPTGPGNADSIVIITGKLVNSEFEPVAADGVTTVKDAKDSTKVAKLKDVVPFQVTYNLGIGTASILTAVGGIPHYWAAVTQVKYQSTENTGTLRIRETNSIVFKYEFDKSDNIKAATVVTSSVAPESLKLDLVEEVKSTSTAGNDGFGTTTPSSGIFRAYVRLTDDAGLNGTTGDAAFTVGGVDFGQGTTQTFLFVADGSTITVNFSDDDPVKSFTLTGLADLTAPKVTSVSPSSFTNSKRPLFTINVSDEPVTGQTKSSGVIAGGAGLFLDDVSVKTGLPSAATAVPFDVSFTPTSDLLEGVSKFHVTVTDAVGNLTTGDGGNFIKAFSAILDFNAPLLDSAKTGGKLNTDGEFVVDSSKRTNVAVNINLGTLAGDAPNPPKNTGLTETTRAPLDPDEVQPSDFTVDGATPTDVAIVTTKVGDKFKQTGTVLLTMASDLASDARPSVKVVRVIKDRAGNQLVISPAPSVTSKDGLGPKITMQIVGAAGGSSRPVDNEKVTIIITSDELLVINKPGIRLTYVAKDANDRLKRSTAANRTTTKAIKTTGTNTYELEVKITTIEGAAKVSGTVNVEAVWTDAADADSITDESDKTGLRDVFNNSASGEIGKTDVQPGSAIDKDSILFEFDNIMNPPAAAKVDPAEDSTKELTDPFFVNIDWAIEASDYDGDSHKKVFITKLWLDKVALATSDLSNTDNQKFVLAISDITEGDHELVVDAMDELGNVLADDFKLKFKVEARKAYELNLRAGLNLISIPSQPANTDINSVITDNAIDLVFTYAPDDITLGPWLVATRSGTGDLLGTLTTIDATRAYWVRAKGFPTVKIDIPSLAAQTVLPRIDVKGNAWNLVPVMSVELLANIKAATEIDADDYLGKNWSRAFTFDTLKTAWVKVIPGADVQCTFSADTDLAAADCNNTKTGKTGVDITAIVTTPTIISGDGVESFSVTLPSAPIRSVVTPEAGAVFTAAVLTDSEKASGVVKFTLVGNIVRPQGDTFKVTYTGTKDTTLTADTATPDSLNDGLQFGRGYWVWFDKDDTIQP